MILRRNALWSNSSVGLFDSLCKRCFSSLDLPALHQRGVLNDVFPQIDKKIEHRLASKKTAVYAGFDPTADSLHIGNLLPLIGLLHFQRAGIQPIALIGGGTVQVGDPSGKSAEREGIISSAVASNISGLKETIARIFHHHEKYFWKSERDVLPPVKIFDNQDWYSKMSVLDFIARIGRNFRMGNMLAKESVEARLKSATGMNFAEFSYQIFQGYDWLHLYQSENCFLQLGGNDQMGNMISGFDLIRRLTDEQPYFFTVPLITNEAGDKLGKSAGNAVWLTGDKFSSYEFYQYFTRVPDVDVENLLKLFTFLSDGEINTIMEAHRAEPGLRKAQKKLAESVTLLTHGEKGLEIAKQGTAALFQSSASALAAMDADAISSVFGKAIVSRLNLDPGSTILDAAMKARCFADERDARRIMNAGGLQVNFRKVQNPEQILIYGEHILPNNITLLRVGKKNYYVVQWNQ